MRMMPLKSRQVFLPILVAPRRHFRVLQLKSDVLEVVSKRDARESLHVFKNESLRRSLPDGTYCFRKHVTSIRMGPMFSADREWLTRRPPRNECNLALQISKLDISDIAIDQRPLRDCCVLRGTV